MPCSTLGQIQHGSIMDRRRFIAGAGGVIVSSQAPSVFGESKLVYPSNACRPTMALTQGPYLTPNSPRRSDIREGSSGVPIKLEMKTVDDEWCTPVSDCVVDIWHCDASGLYSGVDNVVFDPNTLRATDQTIDMRDKTFLRGHQLTDGDGRAVFTTIYPGWYAPRLAHIHVRVMWRDVEWTALDTQLYLPAGIERAVYETEAYASRGANPIDIYRDGVMKGDVDSVRDLTVMLERDGDGFRGSVDLTVISG